MLEIKAAEQIRKIMIYQSGEATVPVADRFHRRLPLSHNKWKLKTRQ